MRPISKTLSDIVKVNDHVEENNFDNFYETDDIFYDDYLLKRKKGEELDGKEGRIVRPAKEVELTVYWARLVTRANCVDRLNITLGSKISMVFTDPSDAEETKTKISFFVNPCDHPRSMMTVTVENV